jgi:hypothetical protein
MRWNFTKPREDFVTQLRDQFKTAANGDLNQLLFSVDFRDHLKVHRHNCTALLLSGHV